jgi:hypothetical protein
MKRYLVVHGYGNGGIWAVISAHSKDEIAARYPIFTIVDNPPSWMSKDYFDHLLSRKSFDIDDEPPGWLRALVKESGNCP